MNRFFSTDSFRRTFLLSVLLVAATAGTYFPAHRCTFFSLDDGAFVLDNDHVHHGLNWTTISWAFADFEHGNWIPLSFLSHALDYQLFGPDPAGHHEVSVVLHALNALLLFWVLKRATGYTGRSFAVAMLWALHPLNVEAVAWIAERKTVLSMLFFLLALGAYERYARQPREGRYWVVALLFALGLSAKAQIITLPLLLLLWDYWPLQRISRKPATATSTSHRFPQKGLSSLIAEKIPLLIIAMIDALFTIRTEGAARPHYWLPLPARLGNALFSYARYIEKAVWPSDLAPMYPNLGNSLTMWQVGAAFLLLGAITIFVVVRRQQRYLLVGWLWFLGALVPMLQVFQFGKEGMADRFAYQSLIGLFIMICWGISDWASQRHVPEAWLAAGAAVCLFALTVVTYVQIGYWKDPLTMWSHAVQVVRGHYVAEGQLGNELLKQGKTDEAMPHFFKAVAINPDDAISNIRIAIYDQKHGNSQDAIACYERALREGSLVPAEEANVFMNMSIAYGQLGDYANSREYAAKAARLRSK